MHWGILDKEREWWSEHRVFLIHSGGDSRRLPQYSPGGKLFGVLPSRTQLRGTTTVFDETILCRLHGLTNSERTAGGIG